MSTDEFLNRADAVIDEWTTMRDTDVSKDAVRYMPDDVPPGTHAAASILHELNAQRADRPIGYGWRQGYNAGGLVQTPPYPFADAGVPFGLRPRESFVVRVASWPGRVLEALWLWHWNRNRRKEAGR